ncbi:MAG: hypothetical protein AMS22_06085 [Thiotrichales bacterium SG8_50]|nr:MAG: hypothetical protein AMS22_06085 [Thiotrichales bacterium SG8_50]
MSCATLYQCFNFLARNNGTMSFACNPDDPTKNRCVVKVEDTDGEFVMAAIEYDCTSYEMDILHKAIVPTCRALQEQIEA